LVSPGEELIVYQFQCDTGYVALGLVSTIHNHAPSLDQVRCVERSGVLPLELKQQLWINSKGGQDGVFWKVSDVHTFEINTGTHF
jgi:hypothetical protein